MSVYSMCELPYGRLAVACYENVFIWDMINKVLSSKLTASDETVKKLRRLKIETEDKNFMASID